MSKVIYETPELRYEVQRKDVYEEQTLGGNTRMVSADWTPLKRFSVERYAKEYADNHQFNHTLRMYRVVDRFAEEEA